jgi:hypothetical protein
VAATQVIDIVRTTTASPSTVYDLVADGSTWPTWSPIGAFELERAGEAAGRGEGVGAIRVFRTPQPWGGATTSREEVVEAVPDERFSYVMLSGLPIARYRAVIELAPSEGGGGTSIHWRSTFQGRFGLGAAVKWGLGRFIGEVVEGLVAHAAEVEARQP